MHKASTVDHESLDSFIESIKYSVSKEPPQPFQLKEIEHPQSYLDFSWISGRTYSLMNDYR
jgi:hypothetical protein